ncbi:MAG: hypothetical protein QXW01_03520 [Candidatus Aenigmatarchaeota archaeon]
MIYPGYNIIYLIIDAMYESTKDYIKENQSVLVGCGIRTGNKKFYCLWN